VFPTVNKEPAVPKGTSQFDYRCIREQAGRFREYGVPLGLFAVADSDTPAAEVWNAAHLLDTPLKVTTGPYHNGSPGRGRHRFYRLVGDAPHFIHRDGISCEFRHRGQYVVGAGSIRPDGVIYTADEWSWNINDVPLFPVPDFLFDDRPPSERGSTNGQPLVVPDVLDIQERHVMLHKIMRSLVARGVPIEGALNACYAENRAKCRPPLEKNTKLEKFLRRAYCQKDTPGFERPATPATALELFGSLFAIGLSVEAVLAACQALDPTFDPTIFDPVPFEL
jgi:hypothetical protein